MKKTAIATLHFYNNFGSVLQAYALRRVLQGLTGNEVDILPYRPPLPEYVYFQDASLQERYRQKCDKFEIFRKEHLGMARGVEDALHMQRDLAEKMQDYDTAIVGSDIVWGREFSGLDPVYFLQPGGKSCRRISYAASVLLDGQGNTEEDALFARYLQDFDAVSVRETSAVQSIQRFTEKKVTAVLDPTLLLDAAEYEKLVVEKKREDEEKEDSEDIKKTAGNHKPYLLAYFLTHDPAVVDYTNLMARKLGLRVIHYFADYPDRVFPADAGCFAFAGPGEFLGYVKHAACIFTNSFHGTCFSILYRKPFYTYMAKRAMLSRVRDMVCRLGMEDRFFSDFRDLDRVTDQVDYSRLEQKLQAERAHSLGFLREALG